MSHPIYKELRDTDHPDLTIAWHAAAFAVISQYARQGHVPTADELHEEVFHFISPLIDVVNDLERLHEAFGAQ